MANTKIQIKYSSANTAPAAGMLARAELAYSYTSNVIFIGTADGTGSIAIGGKYYLDQINLAFAQANAAYSAANTAGGGGAAAAGAAFDQANTARTQANTAFTQANSAFTQANLVFGQANSAFSQANLVYGQANAAFTQANTVFAQANIAYNMANTANTLAFNTGIGANAYATSIGVSSNAFASSIGAAANTYANNTFVRKAGDTITGDLVIQGNLVTTGVMTYANTQQLFIGDAILTLNSDIPNNVAPSENAGIEINRGNASNVSIRWNEATDVWEFTNNGTTFSGIGSSAVDTAAFSQANTAFAQANLVFAQANAAYSAANTANTNLSNAGNLTTGTVPSGRLTGSYTGITGVGTLTSGTWNASTIQVGFGGTGVTNLSNNAVLLGNNAFGIKSVSSSTEGHVLQISNTGVPVFDVLDGGTF